MKTIGERLAWASYHKKALLEEIADAEERRCFHHWKMHKEIFRALEYEDEFDKQVVDLLAAAIMVGTKEEERKDALQKGLDRAVRGVIKKERLRA